MEYLFKCSRLNSSQDEAIPTTAIAVVYIGAIKTSNIGVVAIKVVIKLEDSTHQLLNCVRLCKLTQSQRMKGSVQNLLSDEVLRTASGLEFCDYQLSIWQNI